MLKITSKAILIPLGGVGLIPLMAGTPAEKPLNIVYIMSDDHTQQVISCYDQRFGITTPNIDRIAREGIRFTNSFVANSISGPSRACMLTGKHSHTNGFRNNSDRFDGSQQTMPKLLQSAGYQTALIGKWHLSSNPTGFDYWEILPGQGDYYSPVMYTKDEKKMYPGQYVSDLITDKSINWLEHRQKDKPFCLFVHHKAVHRNFMAKTTDLRAFEKKTCPYPDNLFDDYKGRQAAAEQEMSLAKDYDFVYDLKMNLTPDTKSPLGGMLISSDSTGTYGRMNAGEKAAWNEVYDSIKTDFLSRNLKGEELVKWKYQRYIKDYLKTVKAMDDNIGRLLDYLEANNLLENTLIVYTSDQGFYLGEHGWFDKRFMYEESFRTPLVIRYPREIKQGTVITQMVQNLDFAPTFLNYAGVKAQKEMQGESFRKVLSGESMKWRDAIYYHYYEYPGVHAVKRHYGVRTERYKLIHFYYDVDEWELYDLEKDPHEMKSVYNDPAYAEIQANLLKKLKALRVKYKDTDEVTQSFLPKKKN